MSNDNIQLVADPREYDPGYVRDLGGCAEFARLTLRWYGAIVETDHPAGDITDREHAGAIEVKTKEDLVGSFIDGRLVWQLYYRVLLRDAGLVENVAVLVRGMDKPLSRHVNPGMYLSARQFLFSRALKHGFPVLFAEGPLDTVLVAKSFLGKCHELRDNGPQPFVMPAPVIPDAVLEQPFPVRVLCGIKGWGLELSKRILAATSFKGIVADAHDMDEDAFAEAYKERYSFGGKENKRLRALWKAFNDETLVVPPVVEEGVFIMKPVPEGN